MAAAETTPSSLGQSLGAGDERALFLKMFAGEVNAIFDEKNVFEALHRRKSVGPGKSHQFPFISDASGGYHTKGEDIFEEDKGYVQSIQHRERIISVDKPYLSTVAIDSWEEMINHYDVRMTYAHKLGGAIARHRDLTVGRILTLAARDSTGNFSGAGVNGTVLLSGQSITDADADTNAASMIDSFITIASGFAEREIEPHRAVAVVKPAMFFAMVDNGELIHIDYGNSGNGSKAAGTLSRAFGMRVMWSNHVGESAAYTGDSAVEFNTYTVDRTNQEALVFTPEACGTVERQGLTTEVEWAPNYRADFLITSWTGGTGILRPECAAEVKTA